MTGRRVAMLTCLLLAVMVVAACGSRLREPLGGPTPPEEQTPQAMLPGEPTAAPSDAENGLEGVAWALVAYRDAHGVLVEPLVDSSATAEFDNGQISGNASCNRYFGDYESDTAGLRLGSLGMTEMYCFPEALMDQEKDFLAALALVASWEREGDVLRLADEAAREVLTFELLKPAKLEGTRWILTGYSDGRGGFVSVLNGTEITAVFGNDGQVAGSAGCNSYFASYELSGSDLTVGPAGSTRMACSDPAGIMEQEAAFLAALGPAAAYEIEGKQLTLLDAGGQALLSFTVD